MSTPAAKRRRIESANAALSKPFRSPFKTPLTPTTSPAPAKEGQSTLTRSFNAPTLAKSKLSTANKVGVSTPRRPATGGKVIVSLTALAALNADPDIAPLLKAQRELEKQLRELKEELDKAEQAGKIERASRKWWLENGHGGKRIARQQAGEMKTGETDGGKKEDAEGWEIDGELRELIGRWRGASRAAAEELFGGVRDRVNRMGGPKAWRQAQQRQQEFLAKFNEEPPPQVDSDEQAGDVEKRDLYAEYGVEPETENEREARGGNDVADDDPEDEFTMATMLRTLHVDLKIIGYDKENQRWSD